MSGYFFFFIGELIPVGPAFGFRFPFIGPLGGRPLRGLAF